MKLLDENLLIEDPNYPFMITGLSIILKGDQRANPSKYLDDYFFGHTKEGVASAGVFYYLPMDKENHNSAFFDLPNTSEADALKEDSFRNRVELVDGNTKVDILLRCEILESLQDEMKAQSFDLNDFILSGYAISWEQIDINY
ncbi:hypothetical protein [Reinekea sp. G2M2-21]|uniref:hypothetical protein n=1 Tax=Reinekea sp. G2M2-21 TaxID=2788942 RepID=UPI0018AADFFC|nr:hypothetical protein [Reinekea sp. G2M2-21]